MGEKELVEVLNAMHTYLSKADHNFHNQLRLAYCPSCESIKPTGGSYNYFAGSDCGGDHYKTEKRPDACLGCGTTKYRRISSKDITLIQDIPEEQIIEAIYNGLRDLNSPTLYNEELPKIANRWKRLSKKEKENQIKSLKTKGKQIAQARDKLSKLEQSIGVD